MKWHCLSTQDSTGLAADQRTRTAKNTSCQALQIKTSQVLQSSPKRTRMPSPHLAFIVESPCSPSTGIYSLVSRPLLSPTCASSVLALCLSLVSALDVSVPLTVRAGTSIQLNVTTVPNDPTHIDLLLCVSNGSFYIYLATDVTVAKTIKVDIPKVATRSDYFIAAIEPGNRGIIYSKGNLFVVRST
ncbi:hypothetical protein OG21DRAFT_1514665 [Imleria badia]|nr:hypothetical protein OG21DRAFT_1514665 [Imleria badia]